MKISKGDKVPANEPSTAERLMKKLWMGQLPRERNKGQVLKDLDA